MRTIAWIALVGLLLQPAAAVVCEARCLTAPGASAVPAEPNCHEAPAAASRTRALVAAHVDSCTHAEATNPTSPLPRASLAVMSTLDSQTTRAVVVARCATARVVHPPRRGAPDDSSGTLRV